MKSIALALAALSFAPAANAEPLPSPSTETLAAAHRLTPVGSPWVERPSVEDFLAAYPSGALQRGVEGVVDLDCLVAADYRLACAVLEGPAEFTDAALRLASQLRIAPTLENGQATRGGALYYSVEFVSTGRQGLTGRIAGPLVPQTREAERRMQ